MFNTLVKFRYYSFLGYQEICESAFRWLKLEVLPKRGFWGYKWGAVDSGNEIIR